MLLAVLAELRKADGYPDIEQMEKPAKMWMMESVVSHVLRLLEDADACAVIVRMKNNINTKDMMIAGSRGTVGPLKTYMFDKPELALFELGLATTNRFRQAAGIGRLAKDVRDLMPAMMTRFMLQVLGNAMNEVKECERHRITLDDVKKGLQKTSRSLM
jgi:histone H3/H4